MNEERIYDRFRGLPEAKRERALCVACERALLVWEGYARERDLTYIDTVVGVIHRVEVGLPRRTLEAARRALDELPVDVKGLREAYYEPIVALQDDDISFPDAIEYAYYAIYNLFLLISGEGGADNELLVLNQALSSQLNRMEDEQEIDEALKRWWREVEERGIA